MNAAASATPAAAPLSSSGSSVAEVGGCESEDCTTGMLGRISWPASRPVGSTGAAVSTTDRRETLVRASARSRAVLARTVGAVASSLRCTSGRRGDRLDRVFTRASCARPPAWLETRSWTCDAFGVRLTGVALPGGFADAAGAVVLALGALDETVVELPLELGGEGSDAGGRSSSGST